MGLEYNFKIDKPDAIDKRFTWSGVGKEGGVHIWAQFKERDRWGDICYGGIECHSRTPFDYMGKDEEPSHAKCWLLNSPCWHDGSSLYFDENFKSLVEQHENDPDFLTHMMNSEIHSWYKSHLTPPQDTEAGDE